MRKLFMTVVMAVAILTATVPAMAGFMNEVYYSPTTAALNNVSSTEALSTETVANGGIIAAMSYDKASFTARGRRNRTGLYNYSGDVYIWGSNDFTPTTTSTAATANGSWAVVAKLSGDSTSQVKEVQVPYKYYAVTYTSRDTSAGAGVGGRSTGAVKCVVYLYRTGNQ